MTIEIRYSAWKSFQHLLCVFQICLKAKLLCVKKFFIFVIFFRFYFFSLSLSHSFSPAFSVLFGAMRFFMCIFWWYRSFSFSQTIWYTQTLSFFFLLRCVLSWCSSLFVVNRKMSWIGEDYRRRRREKWEEKKHKNCEKKRRNWKFFHSFSSYFFSDRKEDCQMLKKELTCC